MHIFVYYKLPPNKTPNLLSTINQLFTEIKKDYPLVKTQVFKKIEIDKEGLETWMETYILENDSYKHEFKELLNQLVAKYDLPIPRHYEIFIEVSNL